jgi:hypothetical protein
MAFGKKIIEAVWQKGKAVAGNDPDIWRAKIPAERGFGVLITATELPNMGGKSITSSPPMMAVRTCTTTSDRSNGRTMLPGNLDG